MSPRGVKLSSLSKVRARRKAWHFLHLPLNREHLPGYQRHPIHTIGTSYDQYPSCPVSKTQRCTTSSHTPSHPARSHASSLLPPNKRIKLTISLPTIVQPKTMNILPQTGPPLIGPPNLTMPVTLRVPARPDENCSEMSPAFIVLNHRHPCSVTCPIRNLEASSSDTRLYPHVHVAFYSHR